MLDVPQRRPKSELLRARRMVEGLDCVQIIEDFKWDPLNAKWVLLCKLSPNLAFGRISSKTNWYTFIEDTYPWGKITFVPAKVEGLKGTFPHQNYNEDGDKKLPWTTGNLCLDTSSKLFRHLGLDAEPFDADSRLLWHFKRALLWIQSADSETLINLEDPYELPHFRKSSSSMIAFSESPATYNDWIDCKKTYGLIELVWLRKKSPITLATTKFSTIQEDTVYEPLWGKAIPKGDSSSGSLLGAWILLKDTPIVPPWQAPMTWGELRNTCRTQGIDLMNILKVIVPKLRDGKNHFLLLGFPVPENVGGPQKQVYWQPLLLPRLTTTRKNFNGFRDIEKYCWFQDLHKIFGLNKEIQWCNSENWHEDELFNRGKLHSTITTSSILQLGAGAVGSLVGELLVRAGQKKITIMDNDILQAGNLVRHTLSMEDIMESKVDKLVKRLNKLSPHTNIKGIEENFRANYGPPIQTDDFDIILDCTGEDEVLFSLSQHSWQKTKTFISVSLGYGAKRLFVFSAVGKTFPHLAFIKLMQPWLEKEQIETATINFPREGIGCWHPIFPARPDDVSLMVSTAIKSIELLIKENPNKPSLIVYEQKWNEAFFEGVSLVSREEFDE